MHVTVLIPNIHDLPTGGNIFNRRIVEEARRDLSIDTRSWDPASTPDLQLDAPEAEVLVVDSLLVHYPEALRTLRKTHPAATLVLLAHYLHCIDPRERDSEKATIERSVLDLFDGIVTTSRFAERALVQEGASRSDIRVVPPGLDAAFRTPPSDLTVPSRPRLLTVASLIPGKGIHAFLDVLQRLRSESWTWTLVGTPSLDPDYARAVCRRIHTNGLANRVTYDGAVSSSTLRTRYDRSDVFVLPSQFETLSMATREAMARGLPVVGYRVGGLPENLNGAPAGHLVPPTDSAALHAALRSLLIDPMARRHKGRAARRRSQEFPTWREAALQFQSALAELRTRR